MRQNIVADENLRVKSLTDFEVDTGRTYVLQNGFSDKVSEEISKANRLST